MKGHLRRRGNAWELRAYVGIDPITNRQKYLTRTFRGGKREADEALARFTTEVSGGGHPSPGAVHKSGRVGRSEGEPVAPCPALG